MAEKADAKQDETSPTPEAPPKGGKKKLVVIIVGLIVLLAAIGVPVAYLMTRTKTVPREELSPDAAQGAEALAPEGHDDEEELAEGEEPLGAIFPLDTFVVNLNGGRYLRLQAQIEFISRDVPKKFLQRGTPLRDAMISLLIGKSADDILSAKGRETLKEEMKDIVNEMMKKEEVKRIYFTQYLVQ